MQPNKLNEKQIKDIQDREAKALAYLKANFLTPACIIEKVRIEGDIFVDKLRPYLQDLKYTATSSPVQRKDLK